MGNGVAILSSASHDLEDAAAVDERLDEFFAERLVHARRLGAAFTALWEQVHEATRGGKRIRPALVTSTHRAFGGAEHEAAVEVAVAFELLHTAFLMHDDVIDDDTIRRGRPNLVGAFRAQALHRGESAAFAWAQAAGILAGDLLIHAAQGLVAAAALQPAQRRLLLELMEESLAVTAAGELADVGLTTGVLPPVLPEVLAMSDAKTAHYSFRAPLRAGAIIAGAADSVLAALDDYGRHAGTAFQLRDDLLGVFGRFTDMGKSTSSDLRRATMTPLVAYALQTSFRDALLEALGRDGAVSNEAEARRLLEVSGARAAVEDLVAEHVAAAQAALSDLSIPRALREHLGEVAEVAGGRMR